MLMNIYVITIPLECLMFNSIIIVSCMIVNQTNNFV